MTSPADPPGPVTTAAGHHPHPADHPGRAAGQSPQVSRIHSRAGEPTVGRMPKFSGNPDTPHGPPGLAVYTEGDEPEWRSPAHGSKTGPALWS